MKNLDLLSVFGKFEHVNITGCDMYYIIQKIMICKNDKNKKYFLCLKLGHKNEKKKIWEKILLFEKIIIYKHSNLCPHGQQQYC